MVVSSVRKIARKAKWAVRKAIFPTQTKYAGELGYWQRRWEQGGGTFQNAQYKTIMLAMAQERDTSFVNNKVVADFGCGPRGSLCWAEGARVRIGIDVLADAYAQFGIANHRMCYVRSTEWDIPLPSGYVDVLFTLNAMDHVIHFPQVCWELHRIMAPGAHLIASFNLGGSGTVCEPQRLTEELIERHLLSRLERLSYFTAPEGPPDNPYCHCFDNRPVPATPGPCFLWVRARKSPDVAVNT